MGNDPMGMGMGEKVNPIMKLYSSMPAWGQATVKTLLVIAAAALLGMIIGRLYASVRYPDPDKNSVISPKVRVLFLVILLVCGVWLYRTMTVQKESAEMVGGDAAQMPEGEPSTDDGNYSGGGGGVMMGGGVAVMIPG